MIRLAPCDAWDKVRRVIYSDSDCQIAFVSAEQALRDTGRDARYILSNVAMADDGIHCVAGLYDKREPTSGPTCSSNGHPIQQSCVGGSSRD